MGTKRIVAAAAVAVALTACPGPEKKRAVAELATPTAFCAAIWATYADLFIACYHGTAAYGAAFEASAGSCAGMDAFVAAGRIRYSPADAAACVAAIAAAPCDGVDQVLLLTPACTALVTGTVAPGGACALTEECAGGTCDTTATCSGTCAEYLPAGADCTTSSVDCASGLLCDWNGGGTCVPPAPGRAGQPCGPGDLLCQPGLFCDGGICHAKLPAGASCLAASASDPYPCAPDTSCHANSYYSPTRAECVPWVGAAAACGEWIGSCGPGLNCVAGACTPEPTVGEPCSLTVPCLLGSWCDLGTGTCTAPKAPGSSCTRFDECGPAGYCDPTNICVADTVCMP